MSGVRSQKSPAGWPAAATLLGRWLEHRERVDELFQSLPADVVGAERARCQNLVFGVIRHFGRIDAQLSRLMPRPPRNLVRAIVLLAGYELIEAAGEMDEARKAAGEGKEAERAEVVAGRPARIVHHAVEQAKILASPAEARFVNAVGRKLAAGLAQPRPPRIASAGVLAEYFSHPEWMIRRWLAQFGAEGTRQLLEWNQQSAVVQARWRNRGGKDSEAVPAWLRPTRWAGYYEVPSGRWADVEGLIQAGKIYLQDPATRLAVELLAPQRGETVLDACAAPGGKSVQMADLMGAGRLVAVDLPGPRIERLKENLSRVEGVDVALVQGDLRHGIVGLLKEHRLPVEYPAVLLDVPCSNTGVMRHRVDVKWRLQEGDFVKHPRQQLELLHSAARLVAPGGRLVYSTCSIDAEENEKVVRAFFDSRAGGPFALEAQIVATPQTDGHDGAAAYRLRRKG